MNNQELIEKYENELKDIQLKFGASFKTKVYEDLIKDLKQLDEPQKVTIPQFVADYIESEKDSECGLLGSMKDVPYEDNAELRKWFYKGGNVEVFARAWLDGYEIQGRKYVVTDGNHLYFKGYQEDVDIVILVDDQPGTIDYVKKFDTREEAQEAANILGWKIEEVV